MLLIIAAYIIYRAANPAAQPRAINAALACGIVFAAFIGLIACLMLLYPEIKKNKAVKLLFFKYLFCAFLALVILAASAACYLKDMYFLDPLISIFTAILIIVQTAFLIKQALSDSPLHVQN
jgi:Co/Zn/Cd efflux system component